LWELGAIFLGFPKAAIIDHIFYHGGTVTTANRFAIVGIASDFF